MSAPESPAPLPGPAAAPGAPRILLVDDDLINQKVLTSLLRRRGWESISALNGRACLELMAREKFDLVLMDIQMPEMDGYQTALLVRDQEARQAEGLPPRRVPIVALTTVSQPGTRERCLECGMNEHLTKPVNTQQLYATVSRLLGLPEA